MNTITNKLTHPFKYLFRYWQARIATAFVKACQHEPEVILYDALSGAGQYNYMRVAYCLRCGAMQVITANTQDEEAGGPIRPMQPTWAPRPSANVDLMVARNPYWGRGPTSSLNIPAAPAEHSHPIPTFYEISPALKAHQQHIDALQKASIASQTLARRPHEHNDELKEPPAR